jgi:hypothetical protein
VYLEEEEEEEEEDPKRDPIGVHIHPATSL